MSNTTITIQKPQIISYKIPHNEQLLVIKNAQFLFTSKCIVSSVLLLQHSDCIYRKHRRVSMTRENPKLNNRKKTGAHISIAYTGRQIRMILKMYL